MLKTVAIKKKYGNFLVFEDISFEVNKGEIVALIGRNGAGKSTLLGIIAGSINKTYGQVLIEGRDTAKNFDLIRSNVGIQLEKSAFYPHLSIRNNLNFFANLKNFSNKGLNDILENFAIHEIKKKFSDLSQGMKKRMAIASALIGDPAILLFDEPTVNLDPEGIFIFYDIIKELKSKRKAIIISSHLLTDISNIADRIIFIDRGKIIIDLPKYRVIIPKYVVIRSNYMKESYELLKNKYSDNCVLLQINEIKMDYKNINMEELNKLLVSHDLPPKELFIENTTLKDIFDETRKYH